MTNTEMNRRQFLQTSGLAIAGAAAAGNLGLLLGPHLTLALPITTLDKHTAMTLVKVCRYLYPHDELGDTYYALIVENLDKKAEADSELAKMLRGGVASLDGVYNLKWLELSDGHKLAALKSMQTSPFFQAVRAFIVGDAGLYNQPLIWRHFGYEGPSFEFVGYLDRGFDDIGWLPQE